jgi:hypothetical protein
LWLAITDEVNEKLFAVQPPSIHPSIPCSELVVGAQFSPALKHICNCKTIA